MSSSGADIPAAIREFRAAGWTVADIASDLLVHRSTVYRWQAGTRRPNAANLAALVEAVEMQYGRENCRRRPRPLVLMHLRDAADALVTDAQRAREDALAEDIRQHLAASQRRREAEAAQRRAELAQPADTVERSQRPARTSIATSVDPFELVATGRPADPALPF